MALQRAIQSQIQQVKHHLDALRQEALHRGAEPVLDELYAALEELRAGQEELHGEHDALVAAHAAVVAEREALRELFDGSLDAYLVTDVEGVIRQANEAAARLLGTPRDRLGGRPVATFVAAEGRQGFGVEFRRRRVLETGDEWELELKPRRGAPVPVACTIAPVAVEGSVVALRWRIRGAGERRPVGDPAAQRADAEQEARSAVLERVADGFVAFDTAWRFTYVNAAAERILGVGRGALLGRELWQTLPQLAGSGLGDAFERAMREQAPVGLEDYLPRLNLWLSVHAYPSPDGLSVYFEDIGERRAGEEERDRIAGELIAERALLDEVLQQLPIGVALAEAPSGKMLLANRFLRELWEGRFPMPSELDGYSREFRGVHPDGSPYQPEEWPLARALRRGEVVRDEEIELLIGERTRRIVAVNAAPVRNAAGRVVAGVLSLRDVTTKRDAEARNRLLERVSRVISQSLDYRETVQSIARTCAGGIAEYCLLHVEEAGEIRAVGMAHADPRREEIVRALARRLPIDSHSRHPIVQAIRTGEPQLLERVDDALLRELAADEEHLELMRDLGLASAVIVPLRARGRTLGALSLARGAGGPEYREGDLPLVEEIATRAALAVDNARLYREARRAAEARQKLLGVVSHDLRNALNAAMMHTELLRLAAGEGDAKQERQVTSLKRSLDHMQRLVVDLLDVESLETGRLSLQRAPLDVASLLDEVHEVFAARAGERSVQLRCEAAAGLPALHADRVRLVQVLSNLLGNALQHTPSGESVHVGVAQAGEELRFEVRDSGSGIAARDVPHLFERFWRGSGSSYVGTGLGLTISRGLVRAHGGQIGVETTPGRGATFWFTIPIKGEEASA